MKKALSVLLALCLCAAAIFIFAACAPDDGALPEPEMYYTVTFDSQGGSEVESQSVRSGNVAVRPDTPLREGYYLTGWYEDAAATDEWKFETDRVASDITLYAGWERSGSAEATTSLVYERYGEGYAVTDVCAETEIVIPAEYDGLPVVAIRGRYGTGAFARSDMTSVVIPDSVTEIGNNSFNNCADLVSVQISEGSSLESIGRNAFSGCSSLAEMYIPAGVTSVGDSAFNNCGAINFTVAEGNAAYRSENGHLIENAANMLIRAGQSGEIPEGVQTIGDRAFSRSATVTELYIPSSVTQIGNYIAADTALSAIRYAGTENDWSAVQKGSLWDLDNESVQIIFEGENDL